MSMLECSKKPAVDPPATAPYLISFWLARSSAELMGLSSVSTVRKAARLAVYEEIIISAKKNHIPAANLWTTNTHVYVSLALMAHLLA